MVVTDFNAVMGPNDHLLCKPVSYAYASYAALKMCKR